MRRVAVWAFLTAVAAYAVWPWLPGVAVSPPRTLVVYGFSILEEVMNDAIFPAFQSEWKARTGEDVEFISSFAGSGTITAQITMGVPAEVAILATELDALRLVDAGVLAGPAWRESPYAGVVNRTPFIILVREGNPKGLRDFADLTRPGIGVVHPDPLTSGGAQWAILAEYGSALRTTGDAEQAYAQLLGIWRNVVAQAASARAARTQFENGFGDALITYEQEALRDRARGALAADVVYPRATILSEHTAVLVEKNLAPGQRPLAEAFLAFLWSEAAQRIFAEYGFRSVDEAINRANPNLGVIAAPFVIADLGGWSEARATIIDAVWKERVLQEIGR